MKDKISSYIEKLQPILGRIKPWIKTKRAWVQIGLGILVIVCLILAGVSSCSGRKDISDNPKSTEEIIETKTPENLDTAIPTELPATTTPQNTEAAVTATPGANANPSTEAAVTATPDSSGVVNNSDDSYAEGSVQIYTSGPTGAPLYTSVPEESVATWSAAYKTTVTSSWGDKDYSSYCVYDMDGDGVDELIMHYGSDDMQAYIDIYTFTDDGLVFVGDVTGSFANISGCADGGILVYYRREINGQKYESIDHIVKTDVDILVNSLVISEKVDEYTVEDSNVDIPSYRLDDLSPLE